jgi:hypothetical protein
MHSHFPNWKVIDVSTDVRGQLDLATRLGRTIREDWELTRRVIINLK